MININNIPESSHVKQLPLIDWNIHFFGAHMQTVSNQWKASEEYHHAFEVLVIIEGELETFVEGKCYELIGGDVLLIPPGYSHSISAKSNDNIKFFCAYFEVDDPTIRLDIINYCDLVYQSSNPFHERFLDVLLKWVCLLDESETMSTQIKIKIQIILFELLAILVDEVSYKQKNLDNEVIANEKYAKAIADAIKYNFRNYCMNIHHNSDDELRVKPIIISLGLSPNYGLEIFQKVYHMSPRKYLSELKLQEAKMLIQQSDITLKEIASRLGYKNLSHFSRQFKRWTGICPSEFQKNHIS
ncbi:MULTISPECIES: AraC family transcriptional regulator [Bacillus]|uniref:AraC family transcriptional regulator n=1 Tax=Bacillus TaxID=1386 RepID=UPI000308F62E|nr:MULTISPECIES: AraC family transcriptional regulator [Bacillus]